MKKIIAAAAVAAFAGSAYAQPATAGDFGLVNGSSTISGFLDVNEVLWFSVELNGSESYLDINTNSNLSLNDTEIGLYDSAGNRVANDDDDGIGLKSTLSFGTGSGLALGDVFNLGGDGIADGEDGSLPGAGTYYIAFGEFNVTFNDTNFDAFSDGPDNGGDYEITVYADSQTGRIIPLPTAAGMGFLGLGLVATKRRR